MIRKAHIGDVRAIQRLVNFYASMGQMLPRSLNEIYERVREFIVWEEGGEVVGVCSLAVYGRTWRRSGRWPCTGISTGRGSERP